MRPRTTVLVALALLTAGCVASASTGEPAMSPRESADDAARDWDEDAQLVGVFSFEASQAELREDEGETSASGDNESDEEELAAKSSDGELADGEAGLWTYDYRAGNRSYEVTVDANGTVVEEDTDEADGDEVPIDGWEVDSDEAADTIADNNDTWANVDDDGARSVFYALFQNGTDEDPTWVFGLFPGDRPPIIYRVNATTGEYLGARSFTIPGFDGDFGFGGGGSGSSAGDGPYEDGGSFDGTVSVAEPTNEHTFEVQQPDHPELGVEITLDDPAASTVTATVEGPGDELGTLEASPTEPGAEDWWDDPVRGEYTVTVELQQGATQDYEIQWCAEGEAYDIGNNPYGPDEVSPCDYVDGERGPGSAPLAPGLATPGS